MQLNFACRTIGSEGRIIFQIGPRLKTTPSPPSCFASCFMKHRGYLWSVGSERSANMHPCRSQRSWFVHYLVYVRRSSDKRAENLFLHIVLHVVRTHLFIWRGGIGLFLQKLHRPAEQDKTEATPGFGTKRNSFQIRFKSLSNHQSLPFAPI